MFCRCADDFLFRGVYGESGSTRYYRFCPATQPPASRACASRFVPAIGPYRRLHERPSHVDCDNLLTRRGAELELRDSLRTLVEAGNSARRPKQGVATTDPFSLSPPVCNTCAFQSRADKGLFPATREGA